MITSIRLQNFKGHRDTTVNLGRLTMLVGPNGSGKSSVLQGLLALHDLAHDHVSTVFSNALRVSDIHHRGGLGPIALTLLAHEGSNPWSVHAELEASRDESGEPVSLPKLSWLHGAQKGEKTADAPLKTFAPATLIHAIGAAVLYRFDPRAIAAISINEEASPWVEEDGEHVAAVLGALKLEDDAAFDRIQTELCKVVPSVERVRVRRIKADRRIGHKVYLDLRGASDLPAHTVSDGTLITLALLTVLFAPQRPRLILLDDLDHALHPEAQLELVRQLKRLLAETPDLQIVATTHSPYILDELEPSEVQVFALRKDGSVATKRLSEHPQAAQAGALTTGQLWSLDPERRWVAGED